MPTFSNPISIALEAPVFAEPWEAQAFALAVALNQRGLFAWSEWAETLGREIAAQPERPYYESWLAALEAISAAKGLATEGERSTYARAWAGAAARTPHGQSIELKDSDFA